MIALREHQLIQVNGIGYYRVYEDKGDYLKCFREGGGSFATNIFKDSNVIVPLNRLPINNQKGFASCDDTPYWECICNPDDRWNGWAKPMFSKEVLKRIAKYFQFTIVSESETEIVFDMEWNGDGEEGYNYSTLDIKTGLFTTDCWGYCWDFNKTIKQVETNSHVCPYCGYKSEENDGNEVGNQIHQWCDDCGKVYFFNKGE